MALLGILYTAQILTLDIENSINFSIIVRFTKLDTSVKISIFFLYIFQIYHFAMFISRDPGLARTSYCKGLKLKRL